MEVASRVIEWSEQIFRLIFVNWFRISYKLLFIIFIHLGKSGIITDGSKN